MSELTKVLYAEAAYIQDTALMIESVKRIAPKGAIIIPFYVERTDTEGFVCKCKNKAYICISGTESIRDLWQDFKCFPTQFISGSVHRGFNESIKQVKPKVNEILRSLFKYGQLDKIELIGHSLGASIAIGLAPYLNVYYQSISVTTYGSPKGWSDNASLFLESHFDIKNYINWGDIVTKLLGMVSNRPGKDIQIHGIPGHSLSKYKKWIRKNT